MTSKPQEANVVFGITRKTLEGTIIHACWNCQAPGVYKNDTHTQVGWPGCFNPNPACNNHPVGPICPNCGAYRKRDKDLGELTSSMPRWLWQCILTIKWAFIKLITIRNQVRRT